MGADQIPEQVYLDAAKAFDLDGFYAKGRAESDLSLPGVTANAAFRAAVASAYRAGQAVVPDGPRTLQLPDDLRGDGPCGDCGTLDNIVWFTESVLWNDVVRRDGNDKILCIPCFVTRADAAGYYPTGWRLLADWHWETKDERARRLTDATPADDGDGHA